MADIGTMKSAFGRKYLYLNPDPFKGPAAWRLTNIPATGQPIPDAGQLKDIFTVLPIDKASAGSVVNLFFNIEGLGDRRDVSDDKNYLTRATSNFFRVPGLPRANRFGISKLNGVDPINTQVQDDLGIVWFDMKDLPPLESISRNRKYNLTSVSFRYNNRSVDKLTASEPLYSTTVGDTATVTFDLRNLPDA